MKKLVMIIGSSAMLLGACGEEPEEDQEVTMEEAEEGEEFTLEELEEYDGQDGNDAYVAVDGVVYDVTDVDEWEDGEHTAADEEVMAGEDNTEVIEESPHGTAVLEDLPTVGTLEE